MTTPQRVALVSPVMNDQAGRTQHRWRENAKGDWDFEVRIADTGKEWGAWAVMGTTTRDELVATFGEEVIVITAE